MYFGQSTKKLLCPRYVVQTTELTAQFVYCLNRYSTVNQSQLSNRSDGIRWLEIYTCVLKFYGDGDRIMSALTVVG